MIKLSSTFSRIPRKYKHSAELYRSTTATALAFPFTQKFHHKHLETRSKQIVQEQKQIRQEQKPQLNK